MRLRLVMKRDHALLLDIAEMHLSMLTTKMNRVLIDHCLEHPDLRDLLTTPNRHETTFRDVFVASFANVGVDRIFCLDGIDWSEMRAARSAETTTEEK